MVIPYIIYYISVIVWLFPPLRQYRTKYFSFFLILALSDPFSSFFYHLLKIYPIRIYLIITFLLIVSVTYKNKSVRQIVLFAVILAGLVITDFYLKAAYIYDLNIFLSGILVFLFVKETILSFNKNLTINLFYLVLTLYEISVVLKFLFNIYLTNKGIVYFYTTTAFEILIGIFFIFYNVLNSPNFKLFDENRFTIK